MDYRLPTTDSPAFAFFGSPPLGVAILDALEKAGMVPSLIVCQPDRPAGRGLALKSPPEKEWGLARGVEVVQPEKITEDFIASLEARRWDVFVVAAYGKILPQRVLSIPRMGAVNMHPSLLPRLRGPSPIRSAILKDEKVVGVSIMLLDEQMDHGPLLAQEEVPCVWPPRGSELDTLLAESGARLLASTLPAYLEGRIAPREQDHTAATYCGFFAKEDGEIRLSEDPYKNLLKVRAFDGWPGTYLFCERDGSRLRVKVLDAIIENGRFTPCIVRPEGKGAMPYADLLAAGWKLITS